MLQFSATELLLARKQPASTFPNPSFRLSFEAPLPQVTLKHSPLAGGPADIHYRQVGTGTPLLFLHGGWGYDIYPLHKQQFAIEGFQFIIPDRSGYGRSSKQAVFGADFHRRAVVETLSFLDALQIDKAVFWGHSDGAVISAWIGLESPERCLGLILESLHYDREKLHSRTFFETMATHPDSFGAHVSTVLAREHGELYWQELISREGQAWLDIAQSANTESRDLYCGRLSQLTVPSVFVHGAGDPRTEPDELDNVRRELPAATMHVIRNAGHSPHSERDSAEECGRVVHAALTNWAARISGQQAAEPLRWP